MHVRSHGDMTNLTSLETINHFNRILYWPHVVSYIVYLSQKILILFALCFHFMLDQCRHKRSLDPAGRDVTQNVTNRKQYGYLQVFDLFSLFILFTSCCYGCFCCFSCCNSSSGKKIKDWFTSFVYRNRTKFDRWIVNIFLGKEERIVSRVNDYEDDIKDNLKIPHLYIRNHKLHHIDIRVLTLIVISFGLLTVGSAWNTFIFRITHICTDDHPDIYCFTLPSDYTSNTNVNLPKERITNCSYWSGSSDVQFTCFQYAYDVQGALATFGGLLALFQLTVTAITSGFLAFIKCLIFKNSKMNTKCKRIKNLRRAISFVFGVLEISIAIFVIAAVLPQLDEENVNKAKHFLHYHGGQLLVVIAVIATIPLLPLEEYVVETDTDHERSMTQIERPGATNESHISLLRNGDT